MFDSYYPHRFVTKRYPQGEPYDELYVFTFRDHKGQRYIFEAEKYQFNFYAVKFYLKNHALSDHRYSLLTGLFKAGRVIRTCVNIMLDILQRNQQASFGFIGAQNLDESDEGNTKRFRVYRQVMERFFSPTKFLHICNVEQSFYIMVSKHNPESKLEEKIVNYISRHYNLF